jgi:hypothetical protein
MLNNATQLVRPLQGEREGGGPGTQGVALGWYVSAPSGPAGGPGCASSASQVGCVLASTTTHNHNAGIAVIGVCKHTPYVYSRRRKMLQVVKVFVAAGGLLQSAQPAQRNESQVVKLDAVGKDVGHRRVRKAGDVVV